MTINMKSNHHLFNLILLLLLLLQFCLIVLPVINAIDQSADLPDSIDLGVTTTTTTTIEPSNTFTTTIEPPNIETEDDIDNEYDDDESNKMDNENEQPDYNNPDNEHNDYDNNENENDENNDDEDEDDDGDDYDDDNDKNTSCTVKTLLENMNVTAMLPEDAHLLRQEYEQHIINENVIEMQTTSPSLNHTVRRLNRLITWIRHVADQQQIRAGVTNFIHNNFEIFLNLDLESSCLSSFVSILLAIRKNEPWSFKFLDSIPKIPSGLMNGVGSFLGSFDSCISIETSFISGAYTGQYCTVKPLLPLPKTIDSVESKNQEMKNEMDRLIKLMISTYNVQNYFRLNQLFKFVELIKSRKGRLLNFGVCVPSTCTAHDIDMALNKLFYPIIGFPLEVKDKTCYTKAKIQSYWSNMDEYATFAMFTLIGVILLILIATIYQLWKSQRSSSLSICDNYIFVIDNLVDILSAVSNTRQLLDSSSNRIQVMDTIRLLMIIMIGLCNAFYLTPLSSMLHNISGSVPSELFVENSGKYAAIRAPILFNDGLLIISAALFLQSIFRYSIQHQQHQQQNSHLYSYLLLYFIQRWIRLTIPLIGSILFLYMLPIFGNGPLWSQVEEILMPACKSSSSLLSSMFYVSNWNFVRFNYTNDHHYLVCNPDTWFLSIIFQLNIIFVPIVLFMYESPKKGLRILMMMTIVSMMILNISPRLFLTTNKPRTYYELSEQPSFWHIRRSFYLYHQNIINYIGSFCIGLLLGYAIIVSDIDRNNHNHRKKTGKMLICNSLSILGLIIPFIWANQFFNNNNNDDDQMHAPHEILVLGFFSIARLMFSLSLSWIIYASVTNRSPLLRQFLSPLSIQTIARLSFEIFLVLPLVQYQRMYSAKETYVMTVRSTIENYTCDFGISVVLGYLLYLCFSGPAIRFNAILQQWSRPKQKSKQIEDVNKNKINVEDDIHQHQQQVDHSNDDNDEYQETTISIRF